MKESEKYFILKAANIIFESMPIFMEYHLAAGHWQMELVRHNKCKKCGKVCKTHLHHLDPTLKPDRIYWFGKKLQIIFASQRALYEGPQSVVDEFIEEHKFDMLNTIRYWNVSNKEVIELCPKCHREAHKVYNDKNKPKDTQVIEKVKGKRGRPKKIKIETGT